MLLSGCKPRCTLRNQLKCQWSLVEHKLSILFPIPLHAILEASSSVDEISVVTGKGPEARWSWDVFLEALSSFTFFL